MPISQNALFSGLEPYPGEHPPGESIGNLIRDGLAKRGWDVSLFDNWRDCGWVMECNRGGACLELVIVAATEGEGWFLQIAASYTPWILGRILGKRASATPRDIQELACETHEVLGETHRFHNFRWCWDGWPDDGSSTPEPMPAAKNN